MNAIFFGKLLNIIQSEESLTSIRPTPRTEIRGFSRGSWAGASTPHTLPPPQHSDLVRLAVADAIKWVMQHSVTESPAGSTTPHAPLAARQIRERRLLRHGSWQLAAAQPKRSRFAFSELMLYSEETQGAHPIHHCSR